MGVFNVKDRINIRKWWNLMKLWFNFLSNYSYFKVRIEVTTSFNVSNAYDLHITITGKPGEVKYTSSFKNCLNRFEKWLRLDWVTPLDKYGLSSSLAFQIYPVLFCTLQMTKFSGSLSESAFSYFLHTYFTAHSPPKQV